MLHAEQLHHAGVRSPETAQPSTHAAVCHNPEGRSHLRLLLWPMRAVPCMRHVPCAPTFSSTSGSKFPMNKLAPTSSCLLSCAALLTRIGLPYTLIMFRILMACINKELRHQKSCAQLYPRERLQTYIVRIFFTPELHKAVSLMRIRDAVLW